MPIHFLLLLSFIELPTPYAFIFATARRRTLSTVIFVQEERRQKKNKYANFSKTDKLTKDPLEVMVEQALEKNRLLRDEQGQQLHEVDYNKPRTRNEILFPDNRQIDPYDPTTYGYVELGTIMGSHGVKGEVKIKAVTDFSERLTQPGLRHLKVPTRRSPRRIQLLGGKKVAGDEYLVRFEGISDRDAANKLRGCILYARQEERPHELGDDEYLVSDLVGLQVFLEEGYKNQDGQDQGGTFVGIVNGIVLAEEMSSIPGLGQDLIEIALPRGQTPSWKDELVLVPFVPQIVPRVDLTEGTLYIFPPFGLLDLTYVKEEKVRIKGYLPPAK
jgi:16S rRNA processing protein RimM